MKKIQIVVLFQNLGEDRPWYAKSPAPPLPGLLLAGLTPPLVEVDVLHDDARHALGRIDGRADAMLGAVQMRDHARLEPFGAGVIESHYLELHRVALALEPIGGG